MPIIEWNEKFGIGEPLIDLHHQHLVALLNTAYDDFVGKASADSLNSLFNDLIDYATYHFSIEEELMRKIGFPDFEAHKKEHDHFSTRVVEMSNDLHKGKGSLSLEILTFLHTWFSTHFMVADARIGRFLHTGKISKIPSGAVIR